MEQINVSFSSFFFFHGFQCLTVDFYSFQQQALIWTWCHILFQSYHSNSTFSWSQSSVNDSLSRWAGSDHRHMVAVCWDVSGWRMLWVGLLTPRPASQHLSDWSNDLNTSLCSQLILWKGVGVVQLWMKNVQLPCRGGRLRAVTILPNKEHQCPFLRLQDRHFVLGEAVLQTCCESLSTRLSYTE